MARETERGPSAVSSIMMPSLERTRYYQYTTVAITCCRYAHFAIASAASYSAFLVSFFALVCRLTRS